MWVWHPLLTTSLCVRVRFAGCSAPAAGIRGWEKYAHLSVGMARYGASGPIKSIYAKFGFTVENIVTQSKGLVAFFAGKPVPGLINRPKNTFVVTGH